MDYLRNPFRDFYFLGFKQLESIQPRRIEHIAALMSWSKVLDLNIIIVIITIIIIIIFLAGRQ